MQSAGWEIKTAGWIVLVILAVLIIYFTVQRLRNPAGNSAN